MKRILFLLSMLLLCTGSFAQRLSGTWSGVLDAGVVQLHIVFHLDEGANGQMVCTMDSPDQGVRGIAAEIRHLSTDSLSLELPRIGIQFSAKLQNEILAGQFKQMGMTLPLQLKQEKTSAKPGQPMQSELDPTLSGSWSGILDAGTLQLRVVFHLQKDAKGQMGCTMDSPDQGIKGLPAELLYLSKDSLCVQMSRYQLLYKGRLEGQQLKGTFTQAGQTLPLVLEQGTVVQKRPQHPVPPYPYTTKEVTFENAKAQVTLAGTLTYPVDYQPGQQVPVVLMVTGSGPQDRNEELFDHKPFLVIADYLARHGIASLRYDDRKVGQSTGKYQTATTLEVADDAQAGVRYLRGLKQFSQVGVLGHSEGANVVFMLGARNLIDFGVSLAGVGVLGRDALYAQAKKIVEQSGQVFPYDLSKYVDLIVQQQNPWMDFFINYNPTTDIQQTKCPVFALNGNNDLQVLAAQNLVSIKQNLPQHPKNKVKLYPGLNHLFQHSQKGLPTEYASIEETISPEVLHDIAQWIKGL